MTDEKENGDPTPLRRPGEGVPPKPAGEKPSVAGDVAALAGGLKTTISEFFKPVVTTMYPEEKSPRAERYRGRHYLRRYDNGLERCIGCELCAAACPVGCILVIAAENTDEKRVSPGERYAKTYEINMLRCIFCGYCEEACPVQAIVLGPEYELSDTSREKFIYTKEKLLEPLPPEVQARLNAKTPSTAPAPTRLPNPPPEGGGRRRPNLGLAVFLVAAAMAVAGGIGVVAFHEPIRSVLSLVVVMLALSILFLLLSAQFVFVVQIIVYAGAVMVLFLFVIALLGPARELGRGRLRFQPWLAALFAVVFLVLNWMMLQGVQYRQPTKTDLSVFGTVQWIGVELFTRYLYPFELTSLLLLVAAIGAIYLSKRSIDDL